MIPIHENYQDYAPPRYVRPTIAKLISFLPSHYQSGLQSVVLTNARAVGRGKTHRLQGKKYRRRDCLGFYHHAYKGDQAWIEIIVDNIVACSPAIALRIPPLRELQFAGALFHEIGRHLDNTIGSPARAPELAAELWGTRLSRRYIRKRYWYLVPLLIVIRTLFGGSIKKYLESAKDK